MASLLGPTTEAHMPSLNQEPLSAELTEDTRTEAQACLQYAATHQPTSSFTSLCSSTRSFAFAPLIQP
eukprot:1161683-Pelagomonas_calceolata.AAC.2